MIWIDDGATIIAFRAKLKPNRFAVSMYNKTLKNLAMVMERAYNNEMEI